MGNISRTNIPKHLTAGLQTIFFQEYNRIVDNEWEKIVTKVPSSRDKETYAWLGTTPAMREFLDERLPGEMHENDFSITNKKFESTIGVSKDAIDDDQYGQIRIRVQQMAEAARRYYDELTFTVLAAGEATTYGSCYDGLEFFDTAHKEGSYYTTSQSNLGSSALDEAALSAAKVAMRKFKDDRGKPMNIIGDILVVPPDLEFTAMKLLKSATSDASGNVNVHQGSFTLIVSPWITDTDAWYLLCGNRVTKPLIFQDREATKFEALEGGTETGFMRDMYYYGVKNRFNVGYGDWRMAYASTP